MPSVWVLKGVRAQYCEDGLFTTREIQYICLQVLNCKKKNIRGLGQIPLLCVNFSCLETNRQYKPMVATLVTYVCDCVAGITPT